MNKLFTFIALWTGSILMLIVLALVVVLASGVETKEESIDYDNTLTRNELATLQMQAVKDVKSILKNPDDAVFPLLNGWKYSKIDGEVVLQCYVDAHNSFNAIVRTDFQVIYKDGTLVSLIFEGKEYVKQ